MKTLTDSERASTFANATFVTFAQLRKSANDRSVGSGFGRRTEPNVDAGRRRHTEHGAGVNGLGLFLFVSAFPVPALRRARIFQLP
jgi:hypothetical protein